MRIMAQVEQNAVLRRLSDDSEDYTPQARERLTTVVADEIAAASKGYAIARQAPNDCDEIRYSPGPPTRVFYKDRRTGVIRLFRFTLQWQLVEIEWDTARMR